MDRKYESLESDPNRGEIIKQVVSIASRVGSGEIAADKAWLTLMDKYPSQKELVVAIVDTFAVLSEYQDLLDD